MDIEVFINEHLFNTDPNDWKFDEWMIDPTTWCVSRTITRSTRVETLLAVKKYTIPTVRKTNIEVVFNHGNSTTATNNRNLIVTVTSFLLHDYNYFDAALRRSYPAPHWHWSDLDIKRAIAESSIEFTEIIDTEPLISEIQNKFSDIWDVIQNNRRAAAAKVL